MALLLEQIQYPFEPLVAETIDRAWDDEVRGILGMVTGSMRRAAASPWVRRAYLDSVRCPVNSLADSEMELAGLVVSQAIRSTWPPGSSRSRACMGSTSW